MCVCVRVCVCVCEHVCEIYTVNLCTYDTKGDVVYCIMAGLAPVKKCWRNLNLAVAPGPFIRERCRLSLEVLEQSRKFAVLQEIKLAAC